MSTLLISDKITPITQSLVSSGENAFNYNIIVDFPSKSHNESEKVSNLIFIFNQEDFFTHDFSKIDLENENETDEFEEKITNHSLNQQELLQKNRQMILNILSELRNQTFDFNLIFQEKTSLIGCLFFCTQSSLSKLNTFL